MSAAQATPSSESIGKVGVLAIGAAGPWTPSFRVRVMQLSGELDRLGVRLRPYPLFTEEEGQEFFDTRTGRRAWLAVRAHRRAMRRLTGSAAQLPVALIQRQADIVPSLRVERLVAKDRRLIWDVDDPIWHDTTHYASAHRLAFLKRTMTRIRWLAQRADHVMAANAVLANYLEPLNSQITVVPSLVDLRAIPCRVHDDRHEVVVGWIGSRSTVRYLDRLIGPLRMVAKTLRDRSVTATIVGGTIAPIDGIRIEAHPWSPEAEFEALERMDVGVVPQPSDVWTEGKSAYKAKQYMAAGIPVIADDVGVAREHVGSGGVVVRSDEEWVEALVELAGSSGLRNELGGEGRVRAEREFSVSRWAGTIAKVLRG
jgi:glycosyltransferase involved in cell wall biosynthesis